nr:MAG TPA: hypothetical protein [Caudoviricetes sp.]
MKMNKKRQFRRITPHTNTNIMIYSEFANGTR